MKRSCFFICSLFAFISPICLFAQTPPVVISEVFYDSPLEEDMLSSPDDHHNGEYIELYNAASMAADISGWKIADCNSSFSFPEKTIMGARSTLLVAFRSPKTNFKIHHLFPELQNADTGKIFYQSKFWLSNEGERISLYNNRSQLVDRMSYRSRATDEKKADFWHILANNTRNQEREELRSIVRKDIHTSHLGVTPLLGDYGQDKASPLSQDNELPVVDLLYLPIDKEIQVNRSLEVGTIEGQPSVSPSGAAMYQIPISTPPGTNGFQPNVSIVYNSQSSIGALGQGWDISGISAIGRIPKSVYFDGYTDKIRYDNTDALSLDGQRLVLLQGDNLKPGAVYGLEQEDYTRIYVKANGADVYFELITKDGLKSEFGKTEDSKLISSREESWSDTSETILAWKLNKTENTFQNTINYSYVENGLYLSKISYLNGLNTVEFDYKDICNDFVRVVNIFGGLIKHTKLLSSLTTKHDGNKVKEYTFSYITTDIECRLDEIVETTPTGKKLNSTKINWLETGSKLQLISTDTKMQDTGLHDVGNSRLIAGDMDGDGRPDLIEVWTGAYSEEHHLEFCYFRVILKDRVLPAVTIDTYKQFYPHFEPQLLVSDINNDGINEIIAVNLEHVQVYAINAARNKMELKSTCYYSAYNYLDNEAYAYTALLSKEHKDSKYPSLYIIPYIKREKPSSYTVSSPFTAHVFHNQNGVLSSSSSFLVGQGSVDGYFSAPFFADIHGWGNYTLCSLIDSSVQTETNRTSNEIKINDCLTLTETKQWALDLFEVQTGIFQSGKKVIPQYAKLQTINYNGDGITDLLVQNNTNKKPNYGWSVLSWGERRNNQKIELKNVVRAENRKKENRYEVFVLDYNGDGLDDIIIADETYLKSSKKLKTEYYCHKNIGGDFIHERTFEIYEGMSNLNHVVADYNHPSQRE